MREEFEAWITEAMGGYADLRKSNDPNFAYDDTDVDFAYQAWQASRAALRVELPFPIIVDEGAEFALHAYDKDETDKALQQAGIEVK
ncbi:TPA: hypothetical protein ACRMX2_004662 [Pseudomonas aeruginosa]|nr:hypothetical protein [Pseudomonas aeruginosa]EKA49627.1 hypothetical protein PABE173_3806 [Pseudomonas aeruginosa ATCC 25324]EKW6685574.1 hypothetical protein [Pseudomonas aeruginosa]KSG12441.1 hypothetical protein AO943_20505 [Pseudomonas aeruginosa]KSI36835.1 hypothetical protein AO978_06095 [Pseudomonas aeruginosa]KSP73332.1 hypothetical protein APB21_25980 [Pseudomonas aeruginosa]